MILDPETVDLATACGLSTAWAVGLDERDLEDPAIRSAITEWVASLEDIAEHRRQHPLAYAELWDAPAPRTSQRRAMGAILRPDLLECLVLGGNRTGKTEGAAIVAVAYALGGDHPDVVEWCRLNGFDNSLIPKGPGRVLAVSLTFSDSRRYLRPKLARWAPEGHTWRNQNGTGEAELTMPNGGVIVCKSEEQGQKGFQGDAFRLAWVDEEIRDLAVMQEIRMRLIDRRGKLLVSMTPLNGWTPYLVEQVRNTPATTSVSWLHGTDNPHIPQDHLEAVLRGYSSTQRDARLYGRVVVLEGRVWPEFARDVHVVPNMQIEDDWTRYRAWDFGTRNPTAVLWFAEDGDGRCYVYREHYRAEMLLTEHARTVHEAESCGVCRGAVRRWELMRSPDDGHLQELLASLADEVDACPRCDGTGRSEPEPAWTVADSADKSSRRTLAAEHGITTVAAVKDVRAGIDAVAELLSPHVDGLPSLYISDQCPELIAELEAYQWQRRPGSKADEPEAPLKANDHACDALRYWALRRKRFGGAVACA